MVKGALRIAIIGLCVLCLTVGAVFASGQKDKTTEGAAKTYNIKYFGIRYIPEQKTELINMIEKKLGVTIEIMGGYDTEYIEKISPLLAANDMPDIFSPWWNEDLMTQGSAAFTEQELQQYMPDYYKAAKKTAEDLGLSWAGTMQRFYRNGKLVQFPAIWYGGQFPHGLLWRKDILDELGKKVPTTIAEWEDVFKAFKVKYPNKYPWGGCAKLLWQSFSPLLDSTGIQYWHWNLVNGKLEPGAIQPQFKEIFGILADWQKKGYINPEWVTWDQPTKYNQFYNGDFLVTEWVGLYPTTDPLVPNSQQDLTKKIVPKATFAYGPYPIWKEGVKPSRYVWNPFHGGSYSFGKQLEKDPDKLHKCMQILNQLAYDRETQLLAVFGIEGTHWKWDANGKPQRLPGATTQEEQTKLGIGYYWQTLYGYSSLGDELATIPSLLEARKKLALDPGAMYSQDKIVWHYDKVNGPIYDVNGEDLNKQYGADLSAKQATMITGIISGQLPLSAFDDYVAYYMANGGRQIIDNANRIYLSQWKK